MYLDRWSPVKGCSNIVPFTTVDSEHRNELVILTSCPRPPLDIRVKSFSPSLK